MNVGEAVPNFPFKATSGVQGQLSDYKGQYLVLYFYPKDATSGCTLEGQDFSDAYSQFQALSTQIFGVSRDSLTSHEKFKAKYNFPFELISDNEEQLCQLFAVIKNKTMYGKPARGIERSTFVIDPQGVLVYAWRKVSVKGHVEAVLKFLNKK